MLWFYILQRNENTENRLPVYFNRGERWDINYEKLHPGKEQSVLILMMQSEVHESDEWGRNGGKRGTMFDKSVHEEFI